MAKKAEKTAFPTLEKRVFHSVPDESGGFQWIGTATLSAGHSIVATILQSPKQDNLRLRIEHAVNTSRGTKKASTAFEFQEKPRSRSQEEWTSRISGTVGRADYARFTHWPTSPAGSTQFRNISQERRRVYMELVSGMRTVMNASLMQGSTNRKEFTASLRVLKTQLAEHTRVLRQYHLSVNRKQKGKNSGRKTATRTAPNKRKSDRRRR